MNSEYFSQKIAAARENHIHTLMWLLALAMSVYGIYYAIFQSFPASLYAVLHLGFAVVVYAVTQIDDTDSSLRKVFDLVLIVLTLVTTVYYWHQFMRLQTEAVYLGYKTRDIWVSVPILLIISEYTRREYGNGLFAVLVALVLYAIFGPQLPGFLQHSGISFSSFVEIASLRFRGAYGQLTVIAALWIYIFILWSGLLRTFGEINSVIAMIYRVMSGFRAGIYQVAVLGSMFVGSIIGSPAANIVITGNFTIPLMNGTGISRERAAAIESVASTGGGVLPPIMGSAVFVMATLTQTSYSDILILAVFPALLLYLTIVSGVYFATRNIEGEWESEAGHIPEIEDTTTEFLKSLVPLLASVVVLVYTLAILRFGPTTSGLLTIGTYLSGKLLLGVIPGAIEPREFFENTLNGMVEGTIMMAPITIILASMGMLVEVLTATGLPLRVALLADTFVGDVLILVLFAVLIVSIIFGMAMPIVAAYLLTAALMEPLLGKVGVPLLAGHFFILYGAMISAITPPVALGCVIASNIAGADFWGTCKEAIIIGFPYFLMPFAIVYYDSILFYGGIQTFVSFGLLLGSFVLIQRGLRMEPGADWGGIVKGGLMSIVGLGVFVLPILLF